MSSYVSHSVTLQCSLANPQTFTALLAEDDDISLVKITKQRIDWTIIETIVGYRYVYSIRLNKITEAQRQFLYLFIQSEEQYVTINGVVHQVNLIDRELNLDLLNGYIGNVVLSMKFEDVSLSAPAANIGRTPGVVTASAGYSNTASGTGTVITLYYYYGANMYGRVFRVNSVNCYGAEILDRRWKYLDFNNGYKRLGYRLLFDIDFGNFGIGQTQSQLQDDRDWIKEFVTAPRKRIEVFNGYIADVVCDFDEVKYHYIGNSVYGKTTQLRFKQKNLATNIPTAPGDQPILDFVLTDQNILG